MKFAFSNQKFLLKLIENLLLIDEKANDSFLPKFISFFVKLNASFKAII